MSNDLNTSFSRVITNQGELDQAISDIENETLTDCTIKLSDDFNPTLVVIWDIANKLADDMGRGFKADLDRKTQVITFSISPPPKPSQH